jgi:hypothetical protein
MIVSLLADTAYTTGRVFGALLMVVGIPYALWRLGRRFRVPRALMIALISLCALLLVMSAVAGTRRPATSPAASSDAAAGVPSTSGNPFKDLPPPGALIYFVPLDAHARTLIASVVPSVQRWLPYAVQIKRIPPAPSRWIDKSRSGEWNGRTVANDLLADFKSANGNRQVFILAVTSEAIYDPGTPSFSFVFGVLWWHKPQFAAVYGTRPMRVYQPQLEKARLRKMMLRYIGEIVCNQPRNEDRRSVLYSTILGTPDLDRMVATLPAACRIR